VHWTGRWLIVGALALAVALVVFVVVRVADSNSDDATTIAPPRINGVTIAAAGDAACAPVVLSGHDHVYERFDPQTPTGAARPNGIREFVVGTGGRSLYPFGSPHANSAARVQAFGYLRLTLGTNAYGWQFVTERGEVRDAGSATCH
jgi:hypothetical protein